MQAILIATLSASRKREMSRLVEYWLVIGFGDSLCPILTQSKSVSLFAAAPSTKQAVAEGGGADIDGNNGV